MTTTSVTCEIRLAEAIQYLAYTGGDTEVILHLRQLLGVIFILAARQRIKERRRRKEKEHGNKRACASVVFLCVLVSINVERVCACSVSQQRSVYLCFFFFF